MPRVVVSNGGAGYCALAFFSASRLVRQGAILGRQLGDLPLPELRLALPNPQESRALRSHAHFAG